MIDFYDIMQRVKETLAQEIKKDKILDKDIAIALEIKPQNYAVIKRRQRVPYKAIAYFCKKNRLSINWVLFAQEPKYL